MPRLNERVRLLARGALLNLLVCFAIPGAVAQQAGNDASPMPFTFRVTTREVLVAVVATNRRGEPIRDLTQQDFQIFELNSRKEKSPQKISAFYVVDPASSDEHDDNSTAGFRISLGGDCAKRLTFHYEIAFHPGAEGWSSGYHEIVLNSTRSDVKLSFRRRYYVGVTKPQPKSSPKNPSEADAELQQAACYRMLQPPAISLSALRIPTTSADAWRYSVVVQSDSLAFIALSDETKRVQLDYGLCTFDVEGKPLSYLHAGAERVLTEEEYGRVAVRGFPNVLEFPRTGKAVFARFVIRDSTTGNWGALGVPLPLPPPTIPRPEVAPGELWKEMRKEVNNAQYAYVMPPPGPIGSFGSVFPKPGSMCGDVFELPDNTTKLPEFWNLDGIGTLYTYSLNVPNQLSTTLPGVPGVTTRTVFFGIDYHGKFWIKNPGEYHFDLFSDDGAELLIDDKSVIDVDGIHPVQGREAKIALGVGEHTLNIRYFQGLPYSVALVLLVKPPDGDYRLFDVRDFPAESQAQVNSR